MPYTYREFFTEHIHPLSQLNRLNNNHYALCRLQGDRVGWRQAGVCRLLEEGGGGCRPSKGRAGEASWCALTKGGEHSS